MIYFAYLLPYPFQWSFRELVVYLISVLVTIDAPQRAAPPPIVPEVTMYEMEIFVVLDVTKVVERGNGQGRESNPGPLAP